MPKELRLPAFKIASLEVVFGSASAYLSKKDNLESVFAICFNGFGAKSYKVENRD